MLNWAEIEQRLEEAALTLRRLPNPAGSGARGYGSSWPEVVREARHAYGYERARMRVVPSAREISRYEEAVGWLALLSDPVDRHIVWHRAEGYRWRQVCHRVGLARSTCGRRYAAALLTIEKALRVKGLAGVELPENRAKLPHTIRKTPNIDRDKNGSLGHE